MSSCDAVPSGGVGDAGGLERGGAMKPSVRDQQGSGFKEIGIKKRCGSE